ncbi:MAG: ATP-binding protein [Phycisphaeraceae bacterium]
MAPPAVAPHVAAPVASSSRRRLWLAATLAAAVLGLAGSAWHHYVTLERELTETALARHAAVGSLAAGTLAVKFERVVDVGVALATRVRFQELVAAGRWSEAGQILQRVPQDFDFLDRLFLADVRGTLMADVPQAADVRGINFAHRDWFKGVSRDWRPYVSQLYRRSAAPQRNVIAVAVPIRGPGDGVAGILVLQVRLEAFFDWARRIDLGAASRVLIVDAGGRTAFDSQAPASAQLDEVAADPLVRRLASGAPQARVVRDAPGGRDLVVGYAPAAHGWGVATLQDGAAAFAARDTLLRQMLLGGALIALFAIAAIVLATTVVAQRRREQANRAHRAALEQAQAALARHAERLRIVHEIDRAIIAAQAPHAIAGAVIGPLRELLGVPRAIVNLFDLATGQAEWLAAAGRHRTRTEPGLRYPIHLLGDVEALKRGEPQVIDTQSLPPGPETAALLASGVKAYMAVPMIAGGELIGALSFGGGQASFPEEQVRIAREVATQLAIAIAQARLFERVKRDAEQLEIRVRERTAELEAANQELAAFSYSVSHDLRAPLRAVDGYARMMQEDFAERLGEEGRRQLGVVREEARRMGQLIDDLLAFSRAGHQALLAARIDMAELARDVAAELAAEYPQAEVQVGDLPPAAADPALLRQVWLNLIGNALKYSARERAPRVEIGGRADGAQAEYWVQDNGAGYDERYAHKLFGVFQRLHGAHEFPGTGVGLAIVQRVVARHGGRVWAAGKPGAGARFSFALPASRSDA